MTSLAPFITTSSALDNELAVIAMARALRHLPDHSWLNNRGARNLAYTRAAIDPEHVRAFDAEALRRELMRRDIYRRLKFRELAERMAS